MKNLNNYKQLGRARGALAPTGAAGIGNGPPVVFRQPAARPKTSGWRASYPIGAAFCVLLWGAFAGCQDAQQPAAAAADTVSVQIITDPAGATVFARGELVGKSPTTASISAGRLRVKAVMSGYFPAETDVWVPKEGLTAPVRLTLVASH